MPFDKSTLIGYSISYIIQLSGSASICATIYTINTLFFGVCWYTRTLLHDLNSIISEINDLFQEQHNSKAIKRALKWRLYLEKYVQTHVQIIRYDKIYFNRFI